MNDTPQSPPIKGLGKLIHIAGWGILFCSPFFFTGRESQVTFEGYFLHARLLLELRVAGEAVFV